MKGFIIDIDGVLIDHNGWVIDDSITALMKLKAHQFPFVLLSNNIKYDIVFLEQLISDFNIFDTELITPKDTFSEWLLLNPYGKIFIRGRKVLNDLVQFQSRLCKSLSESPDFIVIDTCIDWTLDELESIAECITNGSKVLVTGGGQWFFYNSKRYFSTGAILSLLKFNCNFEPIFLGKPGDMIFQIAKRKLKLENQDLCVVGDSWYTDIIGAINNNMHGVYLNNNSEADDELAYSSKISKFNSFSNFVAYLINT